MLEKAAGLYEANTARLSALLVREAGKTMENAIADIREAVDFLRFYAGQARAEFESRCCCPAPRASATRCRSMGAASLPA
jgi:RHH-type transcriptional regulator, proline utilization regulon repressor / proline dehydrogenase / delta 1-pyrroline-5-carboxylate dehydrogenase